MDAPYGKTFGVNEPQHMLDKLEWEFEQMMKSGAAIPDELAYHAINIALTAWHLVDWSYPFLPTDFQAEVGSVEGFKTFVTSQSRILSACRDIANFSKHLRIKSRTDKGVFTVGVPTQEPLTHKATTMWAVAIDGELYGLEEFGSGAIKFWHLNLEAWGLLPD